MTWSDTFFYISQKGVQNVFLLETEYVSEIGSGNNVIVEDDDNDDDYDDDVSESSV